MDVNPQMSKSGLPEQNNAQLPPALLLASNVLFGTRLEKSCRYHASTGGGKVTLRHPVCESVRA